MTGPYRLDRALIRVSGPEARSFLQNLLTQNLDRLDAERVQYAALLSPQGKVTADMLVWPVGEDVMIEADAGRAGDLLRRLTLYKLRAQVAVEDVSDQFGALFAPGAFPDASPDPRLPGAALGWRAIAPHAPSLQEAEAAYDASRIALGVPDLARDAEPDEVFALEALLEELHGVDFQKGCFVGQENVSRMKRRATTRKKFCPIVFEAEASAPMTPIRAGEAEIGTVRSSAGSRAIALLRLDRALEAIDAGKTLTADGREVRLDPPPWLILPSRQSA